MDIASFIRDVPDFPKPGIIFKDITPLLGDAAALKQTVDMLVEPYKDSGVQVVAGIESRGFIFGALAAAQLGAGFVPIRKPGKLPYDTVSQMYELEYGTDTVEIHKDAIKAGQEVLMVDDLIATGGTMLAACNLVERLGGKITAATFVVDLLFLGGAKKLIDSSIEVHSLIKVTGE